MSYLVAAYHDVGRVGGQVDVLHHLPVHHFQGAWACLVAYPEAWRRVEEQVGRHLVEAFLQKHK